MACLKPLLAYKQPFDTPTKNGKQRLRFIPRSSQPFTGLGEVSDDWKKFEFVKNGIFAIPCGQCVNCRLAKSAQWATRCMLESKQYAHNYFLTLTYDDAHLSSPYLIPDDITKFNKDLRRYYQYHFGHEGIRFMACGEYGDTYCRPHYHEIMFNLPINDLVYYRETSLGDKLYNSDTLNKIWSKGYVVVGDVTFNSCAYVARYVMKKQNGKALAENPDKDFVPEFSRVSRRPGLSFQYFIDNYDKLYDGSGQKIILADGRRVPPPKYFDRLMDKYLPDDLKREKDRKLDIMRIQEEYELGSSSVTPQQKYFALAYDAAKRSSKLVRNLEKCLKENN